jgi:hypothetical protein
MLEAIPAFDALQGAQLFTPIGFSGVYGGGGATDSSRVDNSVKYRIKIGEVTLGGLYKFGGVAGYSSAKSATELLATWEHEGFGIMAGYQSITDATAVGNPAGSVAYQYLTGSTSAAGVYTSAAANITAVTAFGVNGAAGTAVYQPIGTITLTCEDTKATMLAARYKIAGFLFTAGYQKLAYTNPSNPNADINITNLYGYAVGTAVYNNPSTNNVNTLTNAVNVRPFTIGGSDMEKDLTVYWVGAKYDVTKKFNVAVAYYHVGQNDFSNGTATAANIAAGTGTAGDVSGNTTYTSALLDYNYSKAFDTYLGYMTVKGSGGMVAGYTADTNSVLGLGLRYKF